MRIITEMQKTKQRKETRKKRIKLHLGGAAVIRGCAGNRNEERQEVCVGPRGIGFGPVRSEEGNGSVFQYK